MAFRKNPIITSRYTADPAPMVEGDTLYLYTTHDEDILVNDFYTMRDWSCFSTRDMVNWTDHGTVFSLDDIAWADDRAWAPQCIARNGRYYLYCPVHKTGGDMEIGFNSKYLLEGLKVIDDENIVIKMNANIKPCIIQPNSGSYTYLLLPVRIMS